MSNASSVKLRPYVSPALSASADQTSSGSQSPEPHLYHSQKSDPPATSTAVKLSEFLNCHPLNAVILHSMIDSASSQRYLAIEHAGNALVQRELHCFQVLVSQA